MTEQASVIEQRREQQLARMTETGAYDPDCKTCEQYFADAQNPADVLAPRHKPRCGAHYSHCTCDSCF